MYNFFFLLMKPARETRGLRYVFTWEKIGQVFLDDNGDIWNFNF